MTALIVTLAIVAAFYLGRAWSRESAKVAAAADVTRAWEVADRALDDLAAESRAHAETKALVASLEADLIEAGREASTHANNLTAVMDAVAEGKPLTLVRGGRS